MSGNPIHGLQVPAFQRPNNLELSEFDKDNGFPYVSAANGYCMSNELSHFFSQAMSLDPMNPRGISNSSAGRNSSVNTSPSASTPGENAIYNAFDWTSASESNSPKSATNYGASREDYGFSQFGASILPETPPTDVFTPSLVRRPPPSQTRNQKVKYNFCVFCKNNGEDESYYLSHTLKDDNGRVTCPILYKYKCPICHSTGPVSHTIRYCPHNKGQDSKYEEMAHITVLKQMRSSTGNRRTIAPGVIGGPMLHSVPPSRRPQFDDGMDSASGNAHEDPIHRGPPRNFFTPTHFPNGPIRMPLSRRPQINQGGRPIIASNCMRGPNAAHTGMTNQPCMVPAPMFGELLNQEDRERRDRDKAAVAPPGGELYKSVASPGGDELYNFARNYHNWKKP